MSVYKRAGMALVLIVGLSACEGNDGNAAVDRGFDRKDLSQLKAGIWIDPNGCDHWIIDDGLEGYLDQRVSPDGKPVCSGIAPPFSVIGDFKRGSTLADTI